MCGAQNNGEQTHCWQCKSLLLQNRPRGHVTPALTHSSEIYHKKSNPDSIYIWSACGLLLLSAAMCTHLIIASLTPSSQAPEDFATFFVHHMTVTRILLGATMIILAPPVLTATLRLCRIKTPRSARRVALVAMIPPALAFVSTWLPPAALPVTPLVPLILSWILLQQGLDLSPTKTTIAWCGQTVALTALLLLGFWTLESIQVGEPLHPLTEIQAIQNHSPYTTQNNRTVEILPGKTHVTIVWPPSGSSWLDQRGNLAQIEFESATTSPRQIELTTMTRGEAIDHQELGDDSWRSNVFLPTVDTAYRLRITDGFFDGDRASLHSATTASVGTVNPEAINPEE